jgi:hypothetical protein
MKIAGQVKINYTLLQMFQISQNKKYLLYRNSLCIHEVASKVHDDYTMMRYGTKRHQSSNTRHFLEEEAIHILMLLRNE